MRTICHKLMNESSTTYLLPELAPILIHQIYISVEFHLTYSYLSPVPHTCPNSHIFIYMNHTCAHKCKSRAHNWVLSNIPVQARTYSNISNIHMRRNSSHELKNLSFSKYQPKLAHIHIYETCICVQQYATNSWLSHVQHTCPNSHIC